MRAPVDTSPPVVIVEQAPVRHPVAVAARELDGLFAAPEARSETPNLPDANISQDDLDRLFGGGM